MWASRRAGMPGGGRTSLPMVKPGWSFVCYPALPHGASEGKNGSFMAVRMRIHHFFFFFHDPLLHSWPEAMPKFRIVMWYICSVSVLRGTHWVPWCILKPDIYRYNISVVLFSCFKKFKCLGDVLASVSLPEFAKLRSQLSNVFIISSDFDLAQHFSCSVKLWKVVKYLF